MIERFSSRRVRALLVLGAGVVAATCSEAPNGVAPGTIVAVNVAPSFARGVSLAGTGARVDSVRVTLRRPGSTDIVLDTAVAFPANADSLALTLQVEVTSGSEAFNAQMRLTAGTQLLFDGTREVRATVGTLGGNRPVVIPMTYVGPGASVAAITIAPRDTALTFGDSIRFRVTARDSAGASVTTFLTSWTSSDTTFARVSDVGTLIAPTRRGPVFVRVRTPNGIRDSARVVIAPRAVVFRLESGNGQSAPVDQPTPDPIIVRVLAADSLGVPGVAIRARGFGPAGGTIADSLGVTDASGRFRLQPRLGRLAGLYRVHLVAALFDTVRVTATATPGASARIGIASGDGQIGVAGSAAATPFAARVRDAFGNAVSGAPVRFRIGRGAGTLSDSAAVTDTAGIARTTYTLGTAVSDDSISARLISPAPDTSLAVFRISSRAGGAVALAKVDGDGVRATVATNVPATPAVIVRDRFGNAVVNALINFGIATGGGSLDSVLVRVRTSAAGIARVPRWTLGTLAGSNTLVAALDSTTFVTFTATGTAGARALIASVRGDGQSTAAGAVTSITPAARVTDIYGNGVPAVRVRFAVTAGGSSVGTDTLVATDSTGIAAVRTWKMGTTVGSNSLSASTDSVTGGPVVFAGTTVPAALASLILVSGDSLVGALEQDVLQPVVVQAKDAFGNVVAGATISAASVGGGTLSSPVSTDVAGTASLTLRAGTISGPVTFTVSATNTGGTASRNLTVFGTRGRPRIAGGWFNACNVDDAGVAFCWGDNEFGHLGRAATYSSNPFSSTVGAVDGVTRFTTIASAIANNSVGGTGFTCGLTAAGAAWCWGANTSNQLSIASTDGCEFSNYGTSPIVNCAKSPLPVSGIPALVAITAAGAAGGVAEGFVCGLTADGSAWCWGSNATGSLGNGSTGGFSTPAPVTGGLKFVQIDAGSAFVCGLTAAGEIWCWGLNASGELGDGTTTSRSAPVRVSSGQRFASMSAGARRTCAVTLAGAAYCWGANSYTTTQYDLGTADRSSTLILVPTPVVGGITFSSVVVGTGTMCALTATGSAYCWGSNGSGRTGTGLSAAALRTPTPVLGGIQFLEIALGIQNSLGRGTDGTLWSWGSNVAGELGLGAGCTATGCRFAQGPVRVNVTGTAAGAANVIVPISVTSQRSTAGAIAKNAMAFRVVDASGFGVPNITVTATATSGGGSVSAPTIVTDSAGVGFFSNVRLGAPLGPNVITMSAPGLASIVFTAEGITPGAPTQLTMSGSTTVDAGATIVSSRPTANVRDDDFNPVPGASVTFGWTGTARGLGAAFFATSQPGNTELTDIDGNAVVTLLRADTALTGTPRIVARKDTLTATLGAYSGRYVVTNRAGPTARTAFLNNPPTVVAPGVSLGSLQVEIQDQYGNRNTSGTPSISLAFQVNALGALLSGTTSVPGSSGVATFTGNSIGTIGPNFSLKATGLTTAGISTEFAVATGASAGVPSLFVATQGSATQTAPLGTVVPVAPEVRVLDGVGAPVAGVAITFASSEPGTSTTGTGTVGSGVVTRSWIVYTNADGRASVTDWKVGPIAGLNTLTATAAGSLSFTFAANGI